MDEFLRQLGLDDDSGSGKSVLVDRPHPASLEEEGLLAQCSVGKGRTSGPGGQHRNKVETKVTITHDATGVVGQAGERRSAGENRRVALRRLRLNLATQARAPVPLGDARSELWRSRCKGGRISCSTRHWDFPAMLAEAMDTIEACGHDPKKASARLECTASQLIKFVKEHPPAFAQWNERRGERGMHPLR